ncbi:ATP-grasp domain-containing protein [uncultured Bacteroides sp.]|uniref:carboxylate--amine ligase n=1 Tax=uncultured Bacteroides sp. TaxID=162156 RepID=UPI002AA82D4B|nr:ATP-grasp domain-containing protein [uncultured Bacteroides sp.]
MKKVLILDGGAAHAMAIAECLKNSDYSVAVMCDDKNEYGYHTKFADERYLGADSHEPEYAEFMLGFLKGHKFDVLIPTSDTAAEFMSFHKVELEKLTGVLMPAREVFEMGYDKNNLMTVCRENGFPHPQTVDLRGWNGKKEIEALKNGSFPYPGLLKPNLTSGGRGMTLVNSYEELMGGYPAIYAQYGECHLQQFIKEGGRQVKVQIMTDKDGRSEYSSVIWKQRYYPVNGGSSCCNMTIEDSKIAGICADVLEKIGWIGFADFDLIEDPLTKKLLIMEINPRIPACVRSAFKSGMDYATMIADATLGLPLREYKYESGKCLRHLGFDVLWFLKSPNRFKTKPSWFRFFGKDTYYQDWIYGDFGAFFWGTWGNFKKQMDPEFRKAKSGVKR